MSFTVPTALGTMFLNPLPVVDDLATVRRLPGPLRLRAAVDRGWLPGLYLQSDHARHAEQQKPRRGLFAGRR